MADDLADRIFDNIGWRDVRLAYLRETTKRLLGDPVKSNGEDQWAAFTVTIAPDSTAIVTLNQNCDLADIHSACAEIVEACLSETEWVTFTREPSEVPKRIRRWCGHDDEPRTSSVV
jgi:hypothetical protein